MHSTLWGQHNDGVLHLAKTVLKISDVRLRPHSGKSCIVSRQAVEESWGSFSPYPAWPIVAMSLLIHGFYLGHASHATAEDLLKDSDEDGRTQIQPKIFNCNNIY